MSMPTGLVQTNGLTAYIFPASQLGVYAQPIDATSGTPIAPSELLGDAPVIAGLNGVAYNTCGGADESAATCELPTFAAYDAGRGVSFSGNQPNSSVTFSVVDGQVQINSGSTVAAGASAAVQGWFTLLSGGLNTASTNGNLVDTDWRSALAVLDTSTMAVVIARMDMVSFATAMQTYLGATDAIYTDGGGSTALVVPQATYGAGVNRRIPTWIVVNQPSGVMGLLGLATTPQGGAVVLAVTVAALAAGIVYFAMKPAVAVRKNPIRGYHRKKIKRVDHR